MNIKEAYEKIKREVPNAEYVQVSVDLCWSPWHGDDVGIDYTVAAVVQGYRHQQSCVADLDLAVQTVIGEINGPKQTDLDRLDAGLGRPQELQAALPDGFVDNDHDGMG